MTKILSNVTKVLAEPIVFDADAYLKQFEVIGKTGELSCDILSQYLYSAFSSKFRLTFTTAEYKLFLEYQNQVFDLVENLRELDTNIIKIILTEIDNQSYYLADIVIMSWVLPRAGQYISKISYNNKYHKNIRAYHHKLLDIIDHAVIKNFCLESLGKNTHVPVHCIDYLWYYVDRELPIEVAFCNTESGMYIGIDMLHHHDDDDSYSLQFTLNMPNIMDVGLGHVHYDTVPPFIDFIKQLVTDDILISRLVTIPTKQNYLNQLIIINDNVQKYFGTDTIPIKPDRIESYKKLVSTSAV